MSIFTKKPTTPRRRKKSTQDNFHSVQIIPSSTYSCFAIEQIRAETLLSKDAPIVPLLACEHPELCECVYKHFNDRRMAARRDDDIGLYSFHHIENERRSLKERRVSA